MSAEPINAYPLAWPAGWRRVPFVDRITGTFNKKHWKTGDSGQRWQQALDLTVLDAAQRVLEQLAFMGIERDDVVISTNLRTRLDGLPRSDRGEPVDPGAAVYWQYGRRRRCMAVDRYCTVVHNLAAIAATLEAMRAIERHGGAEVLDRAFTGFIALPAPEQWWQVLGVSMDASRDEIQAAHRRLVAAHPDFRTGGGAAELARINVARDEGLGKR